MIKEQLAYKSAVSRSSTTVTWLRGARQVSFHNMSLNSPQFSTVLEQMSNIGEKVNIGQRKVTTNSWSAALEIQVTCFEEEIRNDQVQETGLEKKQLRRNERN